MKKLFLLLTAIYTTSSFTYAGMEDVTSRYMIEGDKLIAYDGQQYSKIHFRDIYHERMAWVLMDPELADRISCAFHAYIVPTLEINGVQAFGNALVKTCQLLTPDRQQAQQALIKAIKEEGKSYAFSYGLWFAKNPTALMNFLTCIDMKSRKIPSHECAKTRVLIITTTSSGGNLSVAKAVRDLLESHSDQFEVTMLDYETFAEEYDPIMIATGAYTKDNIYRMFQQEGFKVNHLIEKDAACYEVAKYIPYRTGEVMKKYIESLQPDLIISTRNYYADDFNMLSLGIPFCMLNCDHDICFFHEAFVGKVNPDQVKFWLPSESPRFFKSYFIHRGCVDLYDETDDWDTLLKKISQVARCSIDEIHRQFEVIGYPIRLEFKLIQDPSTIQTFKERWDLREGEKGVIVEMGANGGVTLEKIFQILEASPRHNQPIKYYIICGRNTSLRNKLQQLIASNKISESALVRCEILGWMEAKDKNELMNICSLMIGKPGGATQAELTCLRLPLFIMDINEHCEEGNREKLLKSHLAYEYDPTKLLTEQIEQTLESAANAEVTIEDLDWKENLLRAL